MVKTRAPPALKCGFVGAASAGSLSAPLVMMGISAYLPSLMPRCPPLVEFRGICLLLQ